MTADAVSTERSWRVRLAEQGSLFALVIGIGGTALFGDGPWWAGLLVGLTVLLLHEIGHSRMELYRRQRDRQRDSFIALVRKCAMDQERSYFEPFVPDEILAAAGVEQKDGPQ